MDSGINPIQDATASNTDFLPVGLFPQGCVSRFGLESIGGAMVFSANDGLRNFAAVFNANTFQTANLSEAIKSEITAALAARVNIAPDEIQCIHYPRRNWLLFKIGDVIYNFNYTPSYQNGQIVGSPNSGSFSKFTGKFAEQNVYIVRRNGDLICAGAGGRVYEFDKGNYDDDGNPIFTLLETGFLTLTEPQRSTQIKTGVHIRPVFETAVPIPYTITATGGYRAESSDTVTVLTGGSGEIGFAVVGQSPIGGTRVNDEKLPLRWKGKEFKIRFTTENTNLS